MVIAPLTDADVKKTAYFSHYIRMVIIIRNRIRITQKCHPDAAV